MVGVLAESEGASVTIGIISIAMDVVLTVGMAYLGFKQREIHGLKNNIELTSKELVRAELAGHTTPLKQSIDNLTAEMKSIHKRLDEGDGDFKELGEKRESMSIQIERKFGELRVYLAENFASKSDLKEHESSVKTNFAEMQKTTNKLAIQVAVLAGKTET